MNRIRNQFSIDLDDQNQVLYGPKHGLYKKNLCQTLFCHETSFILRYQYVDKMNRIKIWFSIDLDDQNKVPYGPNEGLNKKNLCWTVFWHQSSFPSSDLHESGTIWTGKSFSIDLNDQNQVPIGPNEGL